ncbi:uncharacterized protein LOC121372122 [Gigantopelta aegis]|uniref:uncharacterized protein LOC121372122 n=1 Tax=Gigantopelta aegis TaxID=1735272 RepID=UPI001B888C6C|nr:uncharacterized protein LOC121372122 [Gigantopelta aegis]
MFQCQLHFNETSPRFLREKNLSRGLTLLQTTQQYRDRKQRLSTPDKMAILDMSLGFNKRRLGKQQQLLADIALRCREQEVFDMSSGISAKVNLHKNRNPQLLAGYNRNTKGSLSQRDPISVIREYMTVGQNFRVKNQRGYQFFPARKIIKKASKYDFSKTNLPHLDSLSMRNPSMSDFVNKHTYTNTQTINGIIQMEHCSRPKCDLAPLLYDQGELDSEYQERINNYFSAAKLNLGPRSRTVWDSVSGTSGRTFQSQNKKPSRLEMYGAGQLDESSLQDSTIWSNSQISRIK